jgi:hypothetical protein
MRIEPWIQQLDLETPAAKTLNQLAAALPPERHFRITLFGSAPLQIGIEPSLLSADVDVFCDDDDLAEWVEKAGLASASHRPAIEVTSELNFRTSPRWQGRSQSFTFRNCTFIVPHPIDILIAKLSRLDEKDVDAFRAVIKKTGHPTEQELVHELKLAIDLFRPGFNEEVASDIAGNCRRLWPLIFGREIDPQGEIVAPALAQLRRGYGNNGPDHKQRLRDVSGDSPP